MRTLFIECAMGASGDMLMAALLELMLSPDDFVEKLNGLGIPSTRIERARSTKCGIVGTHVSVTVGGVEEGRVHRHDGVQPGEGHPGGGRRGVLLGDADVEHALGELGGEGRQPDRLEHRGRDRDDVTAPTADPDDLVGEHARPPES